MNQNELAFWQSRIRQLLPIQSDQELAAEQSGSRSGDFQLNRGFEQFENPIPAAVLVPIVARSSGPTVLLTERTPHLYDHAGQISFPGGRVEDHDKDMTGTALRETLEEIGLHGRYIEVLSTLDRYRTGTGFVITPVIGWVREGFEIKIDEFEVARVFEVPLADVIEENNFEIQTREFKGKNHRFYVLKHDEHFIWGATAGILRDLCHRLRPLSE